MEYVKLKTVSLKNHSDLNEQWLQNIIVEDPSILGLGDVLVKDKERIHPGAGRLDLLLQDVDGNGRYEVEIQLGATDESHLIRTIEYWDIERKKYPQYEHTAVIVAENITSRFFNVIGLFNGVIPLMAIQVAAIETAEGTVGLQFIRVMNTVELGYTDEDKEVEPTDRNYWETVKGTKKTVRLADQVLELARELAPETVFELGYNKYYIGFRVDGRPRNFAIMKPQKRGMRFEVKIARDLEVDGIIDAAELDFMDYDKRSGAYKIKLSEEDLNKNKDEISHLLKMAYLSFR